MNLLSALALLTSTATAAVVRHCVAFEGPIAGFTPLLEIHSRDLNTTVMVNHFEDIDARLTLDMNLDVRQPVLSSKFPVVESENGTMFNEPAIVARHHYKSLHTELAPGESTTFNIETSGVYCALVSQHTDDFRVHGVDILASHLYGDIPMTRYLWAKLVPFAALVILFHTYIMPRLFPQMHSVHTESLSSTLLNALYARVCTNVSAGFVHFAMLCVLDDYKRMSDVFQLFTPHVIISEAIAVLLTSVVYRLLLGLFGLRVDTFTAENMLSILRRALRCPWMLGLGYVLMISLFSERRFEQSLILILLASVQAACTSANGPCNAELTRVIENVDFENSPLWRELRRDFLEYCYNGALYMPLSERCTLQVFFSLPMGAMVIYGWAVVPYLIPDMFLDSGTASECDIVNAVYLILTRTSGPTPHQWLITLCMFENLLLRITPLSSFLCKSSH